MIFAEEIDIVLLLTMSVVSFISLKMSLDVKQDGNSALFNVKVVPGSSRTRISGLLGSVLKVQLAAAPEKGKANKALISYLAKQLGVTKADIKIVSGTHNPHKQVCVKGLTRSDLLERLSEYI